MISGKKLEASGWPSAALTGLLAAVVVLLVIAEWLPARAVQSGSQGKVMHIDGRGLDLLLHSDRNLLLVDVRSPRELTGPLGKIPQSSNVPLREIEQNPEQFPHGKTLVLICRSGHRSLKAANLLAEHGYDVYTVDGGMRSYRKLHPAVSPDSEGVPQQVGGAPGQAPVQATPSPREKGDRQTPEKFFDSNMGC